MAVCDRKILVTVGVLGALILLGAPPALAHGFCTIVPVSSATLVLIQPQGLISTPTITIVRMTERFTLTPLDVWAFSAIPAVPSVRVVRQVVVCPSVVAVPRIVVAPPVFVAPPVLVTPPVPVLPPISVVPLSVPPRETVRDLVQAPVKFNRQVVTVTGTIAAYQELFDAHGAPYTEFQLEERGASIPVIAWGHLGLLAGLRVSVTGTFYTLAPFVLQPGSALHNVLEVQLIRQVNGDGADP